MAQNNEFWGGFGWIGAEKRIRGGIYFQGGISYSKKCTQEVQADQTLPLSATLFGRLDFQGLGPDQNSQNLCASTFGNFKKLPEF